MGCDCSCDGDEDCIHCRGCILSLSLWNLCSFHLCHVFHGHGLFLHGLLSHVLAGGDRGCCSMAAFASCSGMLELGLEVGSLGVGMVVVGVLVVPVGVNKKVPHCEEAVT